MGYISNADKTPAELFNCHLLFIKIVHDCVRPLQWQREIEGDATDENNSEKLQRKMIISLKCEIVA